MIPPARASFALRIALVLLAFASIGRAEMVLAPAERSVKVREGGRLELYVRELEAGAAAGARVESLPDGAEVDLVLEGDLDGDGYVGGADFLALARRFGSVEGDGVFLERADLDADGGVDLGDWLRLLFAWRDRIGDPDAATSWRLRWSPVAGQVGPHVLTLRAGEGEDETVSRIDVDVLPPDNQPPTAEGWISVVRDGRFHRLPDDARRIFRRDLVSLRVEAEDDFRIGQPLGLFVARYAWDFGDGSPLDASTLSPNPMHRFDRVGVHRPTVTVWDNEGATATVVLPIEVVDKTPPPIATPIIHAARAVSDRRIDLAWDPDADVDVLPSYEVWRDGALVASVDENYFADDGLEPSSVHEYEVVAIGPDGERSAPSEAIGERTLASGKAAPFTIAVLPDTQFYSLSRSHVFEAQTSWIRRHKVSRNIAFVLHEGDVVQTQRRVQWANAVRAMDALANVVPSVLVPGNHDMGNTGFPSSRDTALMNEFFPLSDLEGDPTFVAAFEPGRIDNTVRRFEAGGRSWLVVALEWGPRHAVLAWANEVVAAHPDHLVIYLTHDYLYHDGSWHGSAEDHVSSAGRGPLGETPEGANSGFETWHAFVSRHANMRFTFSGHVLGDGTAMSIATGQQGNEVVQMLANYQHLPRGGGGFLRLVTIDPDSGLVFVRTYSPFLDESLDDEENEFELFGLDLW